MSKIGILGGTFNPIHNGHLLLAEQARCFYGLDQVLFIPSGCSYMKRQEEILPGEIRFQMVQLAIADNPYFCVSDMEIVREGNSYTCETITRLHAQYPEDELYYIVGADTLFQMEFWKNPEQIFTQCITAASVRQGREDSALMLQAKSLASRYRADIRFMPSLHVEISSTLVRDHLQKGTSVRYLVPERVRSFLEKSGYYRDERSLLNERAGSEKIRKAMEKELDPKRYEHTLGVAYTAASLAMCYGADLNSALIAGMLHDCAKCLSNEKKISICKKHDLPINPAEEKNPFLLHAKVGSYLASKKYGVTDPDILNAILNHTTGRPDMSLLEKIVWLSDYIEPGRKQAPNLPEIRRIAFENLDKALVMALENTLSYLKGGNMEIDSMTQKTYDFYKNGGNV